MGVKIERNIPTPPTIEDVTRYVKHGGKIIGACDPRCQPESAGPIPSCQPICSPDATCNPKISW